MKITAVEFDDQDCIYTINSVIDSGYSQWMNEYGLVRTWRNKEGDIYKLKFDTDDEKGDRKTYIVDLDTIHLGLKNLLAPEFECDPDFLLSIFAEDRDAEVDDAIIQAGLFNKLIYG